MRMPMKIQLSMPATPTFEESVLSAAKIAMSTWLLGQKTPMDLSRMSLIGYELEIIAATKSPELVAIVKVEKKASDEGNRFVLAVSIGPEDSDPNAIVRFEILERKRGLKTDVLRNISEIAHSFENTSYNFCNDRL